MKGLACPGFEPLFGETDVDYWYHGSKRRHDVLARQQAMAPEGRPAGEALNAIYLTPSFVFALACGARPPGLTELDLEARTIRFSDPTAFDADQTVYIHLVDPGRIPAEAMVRVDDWQFAVTLDEIVPDRIDVHRAGELGVWFEIGPWIE